MNGVPGLVDVHVHFMPQRVLDKVWAYFDQASRHYGVDWAIRYRLPEADRLAALRSFGVVGFAPLVYPHKPGMGEWLTDWALDFGARVDGAVPTATLYPEPGVEAYVSRALAAGARCFKAHVQVGGYDPRSLDGAWGLLADAQVPVVVHCGHGPVPGAHTGLDVFEDVLRRHPSLVAVLAHAGMPDYVGALDLVGRYDGVHLDTTMVGVPFTEARAALPRDWAARLVDVGDRVILGSDFPNIPYDYSVQLDAIEGWAAADDRLGEPFLRAVLHDNGARLLGISPG
ncbi:amidohydrolase family protein [Saccharothrix sp. NRRL B-16314]|uniref:amidohydrolase family protein n=1 Tax=Saccharothrix sp. NRRL B-16314 TaxID=1463825 RepID=UPI0005272B40|nr:amidohydrolase family protein [Saccharothrix sp. NRRL B-16314]